MRFTSWRGLSLSNENSSPALTYCDFSGNTASTYGGGVYNNGGAATFNACTFTGNSLGTVWNNDNPRITGFEDYDYCDAVIRRVLSLYSAQDTQADRWASSLARFRSDNSSLSDARA